MIQFRRMKVLAVLLSISILLGMINTNVFAINDYTESYYYDEDLTIQSYDIETAKTVSGSAIDEGGPEAVEAVSGPAIVVGGPEAVEAVSGPAIGVGGPEVIETVSGSAIYMAGMDAGTTESNVYYVDANYAEDDSVGNLEKPFTTLQAAVSAIDTGMKVGTIYICSDLVINEKIDINNDVTILNYGSDPHTIRSNHTNDLLYVYETGSLTLGDEDGGNDEEPKLLITGISRNIIVNMGIFRMYSGIEMFFIEDDGSNNRAIYNNGTAYMYGGTITGFKHKERGAVINYGGTFTMEGGAISKCTGVFAGYPHYAGALYVYKEATFIMKGGRIEENSNETGVGIYCEGIIRLSGSASVPMKDDGSNKLKLSENTVINIDGNLDNGGNTITLMKYNPGRRVLQGDESTIRNNYYKFIIDPTATDYSLAEDGTLKYIGLTLDFYVNEKNGDDDNTGTYASPFATLKKAVDTIGSGVGRVHICSDLDINKIINVSGSIKLVNVGKPHIILRNSSYTGEMFYVTGQLELGDETLDGLSEIRQLTINGNKEEVTSGYPIIGNHGRVVLHNGIVLENNIGNTGGAIENGGYPADGILDMYGGVIQNNIAIIKGGGICNYSGNVTIYGGSIRRNTAEYLDGGGIYQDANGVGDGSITIAGGDIHDNSSRSRGGGIRVLEGSVNITGGRIYNNKSNRGAGLSLSAAYINMSGGKIFGNTKLYEESTAVGRGIELDGSRLTISGNASIASDNEVALYDEVYWYEKASIVVEGPISDNVPIVSLAIYNYEYRYPDMNNYYYLFPIGEQILKSAEDYILTVRDVSRFKTVDSNYGINLEGRIAPGLKDSWFALTDINFLFYSGSEFKPTVVVVNDETSLVEERDYQVMYINNINVGIASVYIYGVGDYGGTVIKNFRIRGPYTWSPPTPTPTPVPNDSINEVNIDAVVGGNIILDPDIISLAKDTEKDLNITVKDEDGKEAYSWNFKGSDLAASDKDIGQMDLSISVQRAEENEELVKLLGISQTGSDYQNSILINFGHHGDLPAQASVRIYVGDMGYSEGNRLYLYYRNPETGKLNTLPHSSNYVVDQDGYITVNIIHCSGYVLLPRQAKSDMITSLRKQISISPKKLTLKLGSKKNSTTTIQVNLPKTLEQVDNLKDKTSTSVLGAVTITYKSNNTKVADVNNKGKITAKKAGKAEITVTVTLYSGKIKTYKVSVTVNKA
jgi:hypothetical protein